MEQKKVVSTTWFPQKIVRWTESLLEIWLWRFRSKQAIVQHNISILYFIELFTAWNFHCESQSVKILFSENGFYNRNTQKKSTISEHFMQINDLQSEISENFMQWKFHELQYYTYDDSLQSYCISTVPFT